MSEKKTPEQSCKDLVEKYFRFFKEVYSSDKEMLEYCLKFHEIFREPTRVFEEFFSLSEFYRAMRMMKEDFVKLIMITSIIEKLSSNKDYMDFSEWVSKKEKEGTLVECKSIQKMFSEYNKEFGCSGKFRRFFENPEYLTKTEQLALLSSVRYYIRYDDNSENLVPLFCYNKELCGRKKHACMWSVEESCPALQKEEILKEGIKEFADFLYNLRNKFVHDAHMFGLSGEAFGTKAFLWTYVPYKFRHVKRPLYTGHVVLWLSVAELEQILNRNFKKLLDNYIEMRKNLAQ